MRPNWPKLANLAQITCTLYTLSSLVYYLVRKENLLQRTNTIPFFLLFYYLFSALKTSMHIFAKRKYQQRHNTKKCRPINENQDLLTRISFSKSLSSFSTQHSSPPVNIFTDRSKMLLLWIIYVISVLFCYAFMHVCLLMPCGHLLGKD